MIDKEKRKEAILKAMPNLDKDLLDKAFDYPDEMAKKLISVQPMDEAGKAWMELYKNAKSEEELKAEGYEPVCKETRLMWIKK